jgi:hypothetical protein
MELRTYTVFPARSQGVGPEHAWLKDSGRAEYIVANDEEALRGFRLCTQLEGIIPALESSHAIWGTVQIAKTLPKDANVVMVSPTVCNHTHIQLLNLWYSTHIVPLWSRRQGCRTDRRRSARQVGRKARLAHRMRGRGALLFPV